jgi:hypothetical protein
VNGFVFSSKWEISWVRTSYIRWDDNDVCFVLDQHALCSWIFIVLAHWNNSPGVDMCSTLTHSRPTTQYSCSFVLLAEWRSSKYLFYSLLFDPTGTQTHDLLLLSPWNSNPWSTAIESMGLKPMIYWVQHTITPPMQFQ